MTPLTHDEEVLVYDMLLYPRHYEFWEREAMAKKLHEWKPGDKSRLDGVDPSERQID